MPVVEINRPNRSKPRRYTSSDVKRIVRYARKTESDAAMRVALMNAASDLYEFGKLVDTLDVAIEYLEKIAKIQKTIGAISGTVAALIRMLANFVFVVSFVQRLMLVARMLTTAEENMAQGNKSALVLLKLARKTFKRVQNGNITGVQTEKEGAGS